MQRLLKEIFILYHYNIIFVVMKIKKDTVLVKWLKLYLFVKWFDTSR